ncbi:MAG: DinB family protein [Pacificimonas sp.]|nr:DinB family protein [Pacificimonas sp.]
MSTAIHARTMASYNRWQNELVFAACETLTEDERRKDRGAFFRSIHGTLSQILWADHVWLARFDIGSRPDVPKTESARYVEGWTDLWMRRQATDGDIDTLTAGLSDEAVAADLRFFSGAAGKEIAMPVWIVLTHLFNHQTHHRGQVHAMLTAAGARTEDTDLFLMPRERWPRA